MPTQTTMDIKKLVTFAFASKRRKIATLTIVGLTGIGSLVGGGTEDDKTSPPPAAKAGVVADTTPTTSPPASVVAEQPSPETADVYFANCAEARAAGAAPLTSGSPGYRSALDRDGDGTACDK